MAFSICLRSDSVRSVSTDHITKRISLYVSRIVIVNVELRDKGSSIRALKGLAASIIITVNIGTGYLLQGCCRKNP